MQPKPAAALAILLMAPALALLAQVRSSPLRIDGVLVCVTENVISVLQPDGILVEAALGHGGPDGKAIAAHDHFGDLMTLTVNQVTPIYDPLADATRPLALVSAMDRGPPNSTPSPPRWNRARKSCRATC